MPPPVLSKADMYRRLTNGEFGNTLPRYFDLAAWERDGAGRYALWGVQHTTIAGFPGTKLDVRRDDVPALVRDTFGSKNYVVSPMIHQVGRVQWEGDVYDSPVPGEGLICCGHWSPANGSWRTHMRCPDVWKGVGARLLLRAVLNDNSHEDLMELRELYPWHVYEFSALDVCFGTCPGRNAVIWEVRKY